MSLKRVWIASPNYSSRSGSGVRLVVVHTAEGACSPRPGRLLRQSSAGVCSTWALTTSAVQTANTSEREN